ncbi:hypothetical protein NDJ25_10235, partial [Vibrio alginolyticus]|nr:hypothetical protein [Vibrio alginolyticus]
MAFLVCGAFGVEVP